MVSATGSSMCGGRIATITANVEFDDTQESVKDFYDKARQGIFTRGYNILHWGAINGLDAGKCFFVVLDNERMAQRILNDCAEYSWFDNALKAIADAEAGETVEGVFNYQGEWRYQGGWTKARLEEMKRQLASRVEVTKLVLDELGFDPDDREGVKRVCKNLGLYRVDANIR